MHSGSIETDEPTQGQDNKNTSVVLLKGEHDLHTAPDVHDRLNDALSDADAVIADLTAATFVDSSIVGVLLDVRQTAAGASKRFAVCLGPGSSDSVRRIFDITGLTESLPVLPDHDLTSQAPEQSPNGE